MRAQQDQIMQKSLLPSPRDIVARIFRQQRVLIVTFLLIVMGFVLTGQFSSKYQAQMSILVRKERVDSLLTPVQNSTPDLQQLSVSEEELNSEVQLLRANDLLREVVQQTGLAGDGSNPIAVARALKVLQHKLDVSGVPKTDVINVTYQSKDPETAEKVLAALGQLYLLKHQQLHGSDYEISFFDTQVRLHENALDAAEASLLAFTRRTGVVSALMERDATLQQMASVTQQGMDAAAAAADATGVTSKLKNELAETALRVKTTDKRADNPQLLEQIRSTLLTLQLKRAELLAKYDPHYRLVQDVNTQIAIAQSMLDAQSKAPLAETTSDINPVAMSLEEELGHSQAALSGLQAKGSDLAHSLAYLKQQATNLQAQSMDQERLMRAVKTEQDEYQMYVDKREQARMSASLDQRGILNVVIADPPAVPALPLHSFLFALATALLTGTILSLGAAFIADIFDPTVRNPGDVEEVLAIPILEEFGSNVHGSRGAAWL